jgi:hypothetical protein
VPVSLYMDHHVPKAITVGLRLRGMDVLSAHEDGADQLDDDLLLKRAHELERALFTQDDDLLVEAAKRQREGIPFSGVIYGHQLRVTIGVCVQDLEMIAKGGELEDLENRVVFLPL